MLIATVHYDKFFIHIKSTALLYSTVEGLPQNVRKVYIDIWASPIVKNNKFAGK